MRTKAMSILTLLLLSMSAVAQESDFAVKQSFEARVLEIKKAVDGANSVAMLDSLKTSIANLQRDFDGKREFLDRALYPHTYDETLTELKDIHLITYDRVYLIQTQGIRLSDLEAQLTAMSLQIDTLTNEKNRLFTELQQSKKNQAELRQVVRRLSANLDAKDKLIFAMTDSIFLPYGKDLNQASETQKEAVGKKLGQANVLTRVNEIATDNIRFLESTQLQPKDYANLIDQQEQFAIKWNGLRDKMVAVALPPSTKPVPTAKTKGGVPVVTTAAPQPGAQVDSVVNAWNLKLQESLMASIEKEFSTNGISLQPFSDAKTFSQSVRAYIATLKTSGQDPTVFVDKVWKERIDREWREVLSKESMLGKTEYAALDQLVSELHAEQVGGHFYLYLGLILALIVAIWWFFFRKPRAKKAGTAE
jgi:hypothetical protein